MRIKHLVNLHAQRKTHIALEKMMNRSEREHTFKQRFWMAIGSLIGSNWPDVTFEEEDIDQSIVKSMLKHPKILDVIRSWIQLPNRELLPQLREAERILKPIQKPNTHKKLYRGFELSTIQDQMGIKREGFFSRKINAKPGDVMVYEPKNPLSFSFHEGTAKRFGDVVVSIDASKYEDQLLHIDMDLVAAIAKNNEYPLELIGYYMTQGESVLLPTGRPIEFKVESVGK